MSEMTAALNVVSRATWSALSDAPNPEMRLTRLTTTAWSRVGRLRIRFHMCPSVVCDRMSKAKQKGTTGENEILELLQQGGFPDAHRTEASRESHDIHCPPFTVEVKFRKTWALFDWIPKLRKVAGNQPWVLFAIHGDRRTEKGRPVGRVAVLDADFAVELMSHWGATIAACGPPNPHPRITDSLVAALDGVVVQGADPDPDSIGAW